MDHRRNKSYCYQPCNGLQTRIVSFTLFAIIMMMLAVADKTWSRANVVVDTTTFNKHLREKRAIQDSLLRWEEASPIPIDQRETFSGLSYFQPQLKFRINGALHLYGRQRQMLAETNTDPLVNVVRFGRFAAEFLGERFWLEIYRTKGTDELSVFFTDSTNGSSTYSGGRYVPVHRQANGLCVIDFNEAYNPYCAYNNSYICLQTTHHKLCSWRCNNININNFATVIAQFF